MLNHPVGQNILEACLKRPRTLIEVSSKKDIPLSTCYKIASKLEDVDLLKMKKVLKESKEVHLYQTVPDLDFTGPVMEDRPNDHTEDLSLESIGKIETR